MQSKPASRRHPHPPRAQYCRARKRRWRLQWSGGAGWEVCVCVWGACLRPPRPARSPKGSLPGGLGLGLRQPPLKAAYLADASMLGGYPPVATYALTHRPRSPPGNPNRRTCAARQRCPQQQRRERHRCQLLQEQKRFEAEEGLKLGLHLRGVRPARTHRIQLAGQDGLEQRRRRLGVDRADGQPLAGVCSLGGGWAPATGCAHRPLQCRGR